ncbi:hypothetical protein Q4E93_29665 [Flavitalea sp. BT771]|uniref:hypothetical protein n=1 Tax=Flavitalea sp. BT771 TaxID=3063329 RepID=UPI0026E1B4FB|nr:hypothetical protein [Flavitalea sp. BT771]MDO6434817.1 hypothetical protein [Flavitalea sp. BT771]MDV6223717.1 hypothetical protein [Flavitalea sp. BT771]
MKKLIFLFVLLPFVVVKAKAQFTISNTSTITIAELRSGDWPLQLQRIVKHNDTMYLLTFRDKQYPNNHNVSTLKFGNLVQLRYLEQGLSYLMTADDGTEATYKGFSIKRTDDKTVDRKTKKKTAKFTLVCTDEGDVTDIQQGEADALVKAIKSL